MKQRIVRVKTFPSRKVQLQQDTQGLKQLGLGFFKMNTSQLLWVSLPASDNIHNRKSFFWCLSENFGVSACVSLPFTADHWEESLPPSSLLSSIIYWIHMTNVILPQCLLSQGLQPFSASLLPFSLLSLLYLFLSCSGQPKPGHSTPGVLSVSLSRKDGSPSPAQGTVSSCSTTISSAFTGKLLSSQTALMLFG